MKLAVLFMLAAAAFAQPTDFVGAGLNWNQYAAPQLSGVLAYAHKITGESHPTYSFTAIDLISSKERPYTVSTVTQTGIAQHVTTFGPFGVYGLATAGASFSAVPAGTSVTAAFGGGGLAQASLGKGWTAGPFVRLIQSPGTDRQWAVGVLIGWGK